MGKPRTVRENEDVTNAITKQSKITPRIEAAWNGITWRLARAPNQGYELATEYWVMRIKEFEGMVEVPAVTILYKFSEEYVDVTAIGFNL